MPNTIRLHRVLRAKPERVYRAFLNADAISQVVAPAWVHSPGRAARRESRRQSPNGVH